MIKSGFFRGENAGPEILATAYRRTASAANRCPAVENVGSLTGLRGNEDVLAQVPRSRRGRLFDHLLGISSTAAVHGATAGLGSCPRGPHLRPDQVMALPGSRHPLPAGCAAPTISACMPPANSASSAACTARERATCSCTWNVFSHQQDSVVCLATAAVHRRGRNGARCRPPRAAASVKTCWSRTVSSLAARDCIADYRLPLCCRQEPVAKHPTSCP